MRRFDAKGPVAISGAFGQMLGWMYAELLRGELAAYSKLRELFDAPLEAPGPGKFIDITIRE